jgi:hypothetical protein
MNKRAETSLCLDFTAKEAGRELPVKETVTEGRPVLAWSGEGGIGKVRLGPVWLGRWGLEGGVVDLPP